jgi:hypothetical protein
MCCHFAIALKWRKNPVPMCNCDIGIGCGAKAAEAVVAAVFAPKADGKVCVADPTCSFAVCITLLFCVLTIQRFLGVMSMQAVTATQ